MAAKRVGPRRVADMAPSKGERRYKFKHRGLKAGGGLPPIPRGVKVVRMFENLQKQGWTFRFTTEAKSPRGFSYSGQGDSPLEAFLTAFGQWRTDGVNALPWVPQAVPPMPLPVVQVLKPPVIWTPPVQMAELRMKAQAKPNRTKAMEFKKSLLRSGEVFVEHGTQWPVTQTDAAEWQYARVRPIQKGPPILSENNGSYTRAYHRRYMRKYRWSSRKRRTTDTALVAA